jgi:hypothetical protein
MRSEVRWGLLLFITLGGCGSGAPPFDELPLRDTLRADPEAVAALSDEARLRLAARFQSAGAADTGADPVEAGAATAAAVAQVDVARQHRSADALVIGTIGGGAAQALPAGTQGGGGGEPLPAMEGEGATTTAELEARALAGAAGASLRELLAASHAQRLQRVTGWPVAAVTVGDTAYVNGAWLVAMAPAGLGARALDGGTLDARPGDAGAADAGAAGAGAMDAGRSYRPPAALSVAWDAAAWWPPPPPPAPPPPPPPDDNSLGDAADAADGCASLADACASADDGSQGDSCDDGSSEDDPPEDCSAPADDGSAADCQTAPGRGRPRTGTILWLFAPLAYLWGRRR